jgi:putative glutamine amidotransferase
MRKLVCLTSRTMLDELSQEKQFVNTRYVKPLTERGMNTMMLTLDNPSPEEMFNLCDAFVVTGGVDLDPMTYKDVNAGLSKDIHPSLDLLDSLVIKYAKTTKKPLLGVCRGLQSINVFLGGTLYQDLAQLGLKHSNIPGNHKINTVENDVLKFESEIAVNSYHHQGIKKLATGLKVIGKQTDGIIEAVVHESLPIIAVQWHPEMRPSSPESKVIFDTFATMVKGINKPFSK